MRVPQALHSLVEMGIIQEVLRPLMSGKEAQLYVVIAGGQERVAKVYKEAARRSFKQRADYTEGRKVRNSRDRRAMTKRSRHGRAQDEAGWRSAEVDVIYRLREAGVRVPAPYNFYDGVLVMELVTDANGQPAPRLGDLSFSPADAREVYARVLQEVVRMLCAGVVHGDLSDFNILMSADGPVIIDFPQAVDPASNSNARSLLIRDVDNLHTFLGRAVRHSPAPYAQEMWALFERNELSPETRLSGQFRDKRRKANTKDVLGLIGDAARDEERRRSGQQQGQGRRSRGRRSKGGAAQAQQVQVLVRSSEGRAQVVRSGRAAEPNEANRSDKQARSGNQARSEKPPRSDKKPPRSDKKPRFDKPARSDTPARAGKPRSGKPSRADESAPERSQAAAGAKDDSGPKKRRRRRRRRPRSEQAATKPDGSSAPPTP